MQQRCRPVRVAAAGRRRRWLLSPELAKLAAPPHPHASPEDAVPVRQKMHVLCSDWDSAALLTRRIVSLPSAVKKSESEGGNGSEQGAQRQ